MESTGNRRQSKQFQGGYMETHHRIHPQNGRQRHPLSGRLARVSVGIVIAALLMLSDRFGVSAVSAASGDAPLASTRRPTMTYFVTEGPGGLIFGQPQGGILVVNADGSASV